MVRVLYLFPKIILAGERMVLISWLNDEGNLVNYSWFPDSFLPEVAVVCPLSVFHKEELQSG